MSEIGAGAIRTMLGMIGDPDATDSEVARILVGNETAIRAFLNERDRLTKERDAFAKAAVEKDREKVAILMLKHGIATGHGDIIDDLLAELSGYLAGVSTAVEKERERAALLADGEAKAAKRFFDATRYDSEKKTQGAVILSARRLAAQIRSGESP